MPNHIKIAGINDLSTQNLLHLYTLQLNPKESITIKKLHKRGGTKHVKNQVFFQPISINHLYTSSIAETILQAPKIYYICTLYNQIQTKPSPSRSYSIHKNGGTKLNMLKIESFPKPLPK